MPIALSWNNCSCLCLNKSLPVFSGYIVESLSVYSGYFLQLMMCDSMQLNEEPSHRVVLFFPSLINKWIHVRYFAQCGSALPQASVLQGFRLVTSLYRRNSPKSFWWKVNIITFKSSFVTISPQRCLLYWMHGKIHQLCINYAWYLPHPLLQEGWHMEFTNFKHNR